MGFFNQLFNGPTFAEGVAQAAQTPGAVLLDVRTPQEYQEGHLPGSLNLPLNQLGGIGLPLDTPLFVYCLSGARSGRACSALNRLGYTHVTNIGGISGYQGTLE